MTYIFIFIVCHAVIATTYMRFSLKGHVIAERKSCTRTNKTSRQNIQKWKVGIELGNKRTYKLSPPSLFKYRRYSLALLIKIFISRLIFFDDFFHL